MKSVLLILLLPVVCFGQLINPHVMPFGSYTTAGGPNFYTSGRRDTLREELGLNTFTAGGFDQTTVDNWAADGIYPYPWQTMPYIDPQLQYAGANYYLCQPESSSFYEIDFETVSGVPQDSYLVYRDSGQMLGDLGMWQENNYVWLDNHWFYYRPAIKIRRQIGIGSDDTLGIFEARKDGVLFFKDYIVGRDVPVDADTILYMKNDSFPPYLDYYTIRDDTISGNAYIRYDFATTGICSVYVDYFKVHDQYGKDLVEGSDSTIVNRIKESVGRAGYDGKIFGWFLKDTQRVMNWRPYAYIDKLIRDTTSVWDYPVRAASWVHFWPGNDHHRGFSDFLKIAKPAMLWAYLYPISINTAYTGYSGSPYDLFQDRLNTIIALPGDDIRQAISENGDSIPWLFTPEFWYCDPDDPDTLDRDGCDEEPVRRETRSELRCMTYMGLCYHPKAMIFWKYDSQGSPNGITDSQGDPRAGMYEAVRDDINPYIKALDSIYLGLEWERAFTYTSDSADTFDVPPDDIISSISAVSNTGDPNPDLGWFQVGEFHDNNSKYVMIVNRACSQGTTDSSEAPSITATVRLNTEVVGYDYAYITDIAASLDTVGGEWIGVPQVIYSTTMSGRTIPFTITLRAGEGRLFKIEETSQKSFSGEINTDYIYQGNIGMTANAVIPEDKTLIIKGPAKIEVVRCNKYELDIKGKLLALGVPTDSVIFTSDTTWDCIPSSVHPVPGDWYGIRDNSADYDTLLYCSIKYAYDGFRADTNSNALIRHCEIANSEANGVYLYNTNSNPTTVDSCRIGNNGCSGINSYSSYFVARGNTIESNLTYGIYFKKRPGVAVPQLVISDNFVSRGDSATFVGVKIEGNYNDNNLPRADFSGNAIEGFLQAGVHIYRCDTGANGMVFSGANSVVGNDPFGLYCDNSSPWIYSSDGTCERYNSFSSNIGYGIYCADHSSPKIRQSFLENNTESNVYCNTGSWPNLGDGTFDGENSFVTIDYDIMVYSTGDKVYARGNWWEESGHDKYDFYPLGSVDFTNPLTSDPCPTDPGFGRVAVSGGLPNSFALSQNYPNPFNPTTNIEFDLPENSFVKLSVFNILGQRIRTVASSDYPAGSHLLRWDGRADNGEEVSSGVYFYLLEAGDYRSAKKMLMVR